MNLFNYIDRQVLAAVEPEIAESLLLSSDPDDPNVQAKMGALASAFLFSYMLAAPVFGVLAERWPRWKLIAVGIAVWTVASGASGLVTTFVMLLVMRCFVGIGEGAYGPIAPTVLSDYFPIAVRGRIMAWFYMAIPVGGALGYALGGYFAGLDKAGESWRWAFYAVVPPGLLLTLASLVLREPARGAAEGVAAPRRRIALRDLRLLAGTPSYVLATLGMAAMTFAIGAFAFWMPRYLKSSGVPPCLGIEPRMFFGVITAVAGLTGTMAGGLYGDRLRRRFAGSYFLVSGVGMLISVPSALMFVYTPFPLAWAFIFITVFFLFFNTGPTNTILANVVHPSIRATAFAVNILIIHSLGDALSPTLVGAMADHYKSLRPGFALVAAFMALGGLLWLWGARYLERDTESAPLRLP
jgi:MFS family permease